MGSDPLCEGSGECSIAAPADIATARESTTKIAYTSDGDDSDDASAASLATTCCTAHSLSARSDCCNDTCLGQARQRCEERCDMFTDVYDVTCSAADLAAARDMYAAFPAYRGRGRGPPSAGGEGAAKEAACIFSCGEQRRGMAC